MHEGLDIRCLQRDRHGEPTDPVLATADGTVAYISTRPSLSNYGNYLVLRHQVEGLEIYSLYAHLREVRHDLKIGQPVKAGERSPSWAARPTRAKRISKDRAHVHFELNLFVNDRFASWYKKTFPSQRNDHGEWNGQNLLGIDPRPSFWESMNKGRNSACSASCKARRSCAASSCARRFPVAETLCRPDAPEPARREGRRGRLRNRAQLQRRGLRAHSARRLRDQGQGQVPAPFGSSRRSITRTQHGAWWPRGAVAGNSPATD